MSGGGERKSLEIPLIEKIKRVSAIVHDEEEHEHNKFAQEHGYRDTLTKPGESFFDRIKANLISGVTVGLVNLPLSISLSVAGGGTPQAGVITAVISGFVSGALGGSDFNIIGPTGALSSFLYEACEYYKTEWGHDINPLPVLSIFTGIVILFGYLIKIEDFIEFVPISVNEGFTVGVSLILVCGQLNNLFSLDVKRTHSIPENLHTTFSHIMDTSPFSLILGGGFLIGLLSLVKLRPKIPWICIFTVIGIIIGTFRDSIVQEKRQLYLLIDKFPNLSFDKAFQQSFDMNIMWDPKFISQILPISFVAILETLISAKVAEQTTKVKFNKRKEMMGLGVCNCLGGLFGGIPATAALARTKLNILSGGKNKISSTINSIVMVLITVFFFKLFKYLPMCVLAASVMYVAIRMVDYDGLKTLFKAEKEQFRIVLVMAFISIFFDSTYAIIVGMFMYLIGFLEKFLVAKNEILVGTRKDHSEINKKDYEIDSSKEESYFSIALTTTNGELHNKQVIASHTSFLFMVDLEDYQMLDKKKKFILYRLMGVVNFMNIGEHVELLNKITSRYDNIILSFRYCNNLDKIAVHELEKFFDESLNKGKSVLLTFLDRDMINKMRAVCGEAWIAQHMAKNKVSLSLIYK